MFIGPMGFIGLIGFIEFVGLIGFGFKRGSIQNRGLHKQRYKGTLDHSSGSYPGFYSSMLLGLRKCSR